jgi:pimeloyl-ACP methyl ester carboxylesterase
MKSGFAKAEGAELYFERRGGGPPLLMIAGGGGDCGVYNAIGEILGSSFTVLSYDRRGNSRSRLLGRPTKLELAQQSDDAIAVLRANGFESARVFGSSGGASIALDLAARHPEAVEAAMPHEPPTPKLLPDAEQILSSYDEIDRVMEREGWEAAFKLFLELNKLTPPGEPVAMKALLRPETVLPPGQLLDLLRRQSCNWEYMMKYEVPPFIRYIPDLDQIKKSGVRIALASGVQTRGQYFHRASEVIAVRLGVEHVEFPGGHSGATEVAEAFAAKLQGVFQDL